jgi:hypothetical protein
VRSLPAALAVEPHAYSTRSRRERLHSHRSVLRSSPLSAEVHPEQTRALAFASFGSPLIASVGRGFVLRMPTSADYIRGRRGHCAQSRHCRKACSALAICPGSSSSARKAVSYMMPASRTAASTSEIFGRNIAVVRRRSQVVDVVLGWAHGRGPQLLRDWANYPAPSSAW